MRLVMIRGSQILSLILTFSLAPCLNSPGADLSSYLRTNLASHSATHAESCPTRQTDCVEKSRRGVGDPLWLPRFASSEDRRSAWASFLAIDRILGDHSWEGSLRMQGGYATSEKQRESLHWDKRMKVLQEQEEEPHAAERRDKVSLLCRGLSRGIDHLFIRAKGLLVRIDADVPCVSLYGRICSRQAIRIDLFGCRLQCQSFSKSFWLSFLW